MANRKLSEHTAITGANVNPNADYIEILDVSDTTDAASGTNKKILPSQLLIAIGAEPAKGADDNYVTDAEKVVIGNTSGTNTGDNAVNSNYSGLAASISAEATTRATDDTTLAGLITTEASTRSTADTTLQTNIDNKVTKNANITPATKTKVTYDAKGLVTSGADATTADIADSTNKRYVTDADLVDIGNLSGTNSGDNAANSLYSGLVTNATHTGEVTGSGALTVDKTAITNKTAVTPATDDYILISDTSDSGNLKKALISGLPSGGGSGDMLLAGSQTITGYFDNSYTSVVSRPALAYTGTAYTGGTATTTKPHLLIEPSGTTSTNWQTTGTYFGINGASGFTGYLIDAQINAVQKFAVSKDGIIVGVGSASLPSIRFTGWSANNGIYSNADGQIAITNSGTQSWIIAGFAISANSTRGPYLRQGTGAAASPTYAFNGDTNTGMWSSGADTIDFTTAGTNRVSMVNTRTTFLHRLNTSKGADVASANDLTLGTDGNVFVITGTTTINAILTTSWDAGAEVVLIFSGATTVKHNTAGGASTARIFLSGSVDLTTAANTILCLVYDGTQWQETSKKAA